jgi:hypothetical protein
MFDPIAYKSTTRAQWEVAAEPWHRYGTTLEHAPRGWNRS